MKSLAQSPVPSQILQHELQDRQKTHPTMQKTSLTSPQARNPKLWKVSQQFEAIFLQQMLEAMHKTVPHDGFMPNDFAEQVHESMFDQAVASAISKNSNLGIASAIYRQLAHTDQTQVKTEAADNVSKQGTSGSQLDSQGEADGTH